MISEPSARAEGPHYPDLEINPVSPHWPPGCNPPVRRPYPARNHFRPTEFGHLDAKICLFHDHDIFVAAANQLKMPAPKKHGMVTKK